jgi:predicted nuclease of predicted toxin-antitoxin system
MKFLIDLNLSLAWALTATDSEVMTFARASGYIVLTHDLDFGMLLHATQAQGPSVVQLRIEDVRPIESGALLLQGLKEAESALAETSWGPTRGGMGMPPYACTRYISYTI